MADEIVETVDLETPGSSFNPDTSNALDELLKQTQKTPEQLAEETAEAERAAEKAKEKTPEQLAEEKAAADKAEADRAAAEKSKDPFDAVELPPYTKPKAAEAFATVKTLARERIAAAEEKARVLAEELAAANKKAGEAGKLPPEVEKELIELREFRQKLDVEADPSFREFDSKITSNDELIYAKLKQAGVDDAGIDKIKKFGGPKELDLESLGDKLPAPIRRYIEGKVFENEDLAAKKDQAIAQAKKNAGEFLKAREEATQTSAASRQKAVETQITEMRPQLAWLQPKDIPANAKPEEKAALQAHNAFVAKIEGDLKDVIADDSPTMRAILVLGYAQLHKVRDDLAAEKAASKKAEDAHKAALAEVEGKLKKAEDLIARIKGSSTTRLRDSSAPGAGDPKAKAKVNLNEDTGSALDRLRAEHEAAKAKE